MTDGMSVRCYAVRRLNPFLGVLHVIETPKGRASTSNGLVWHLELLAQKEPSWGSLSVGVDVSWYLYGLWSEKDGMVVSHMGEQMGEQAAVVCDQILQLLMVNRHDLPFALADRNELWLLDKDDKKPLALVFSSQSEIYSLNPDTRHWKGCLGREGVLGQRRFPAVKQLEARVRNRAGFNLSRIWVNWDDDRKSVQTLDGKSLNAKHFPIFGIREDWLDSHSELMVRDYIQWIAPSLLTLSYLDKDERIRLEQCLTNQACSIEYHWRLYPKIIDQAKLNAARVQARFQMQFRHQD